MYWRFAPKIGLGAGFTCRVLCVKPRREEECLTLGVCSAIIGIIRKDI